MNKVKACTLLISILATGCSTIGHSQGSMHDGNVMVINHGSHTGAVTRGAHYTQFSQCTPDLSVCFEMDTVKGGNPTVAEQLFTGASNIASQAVRRPDETNVSGTSGSNSSAFAGASSRSRATINNNRGWMGQGGMD